MTGACCCCIGTAQFFVAVGLAAYLFVLCIAQALLGDGPFAFSVSRPLSTFLVKPRIKPSRADPRSPPLLRKASP